MLKPGSPHDKNRHPSLLFPTSCVVPQVLAFLGLFSEIEKQCEEEGESQNSRLPSSHSTVMVRVKDGDVSLCLMQSRGQPAQPLALGPPKIWRDDFLHPANQFFSCVLPVGLPHPPLLPPLQSSSTPRCISSLSRYSAATVGNCKSLHTLEKSVLSTALV